MKTAIAAAALAASATANDLKLTWKDCGDASTHVKISSFSPATLTLGQKTTMTGTGTLDEDVEGGDFDLEMKGMIGKLLSCKGDSSVGKTCSLPLGSGSLTFDPIKFPLKKGSGVPVSVDITLSAHLPALLANTKTTASGTTKTGDKLFCIEIDSSKEAKQRQSEVLSREETEKLGDVWRGNSSNTNSHLQLSAPQTYTGIVV